MSNILLTSIGTGKYDAKTKEIGYSNTRYAVNEDRANVVESAYIYDAMIELKKIDKIIFIGTTGSDWHALYEHLFYENSRITPLKPRSEDYALELYELKESKEKDLDKCREKLQTLVDTMGGVCSDIIILHYGLSIEEMNENFDRLAKAKKYIGKDDVLSFDITHSFRSLAFYELLAVNFFKLSMREGDRLDFVSYGMFEGQGEDGSTPIVNQEPLLKLLDWTKAADEFKRFGTTHLLDQLRKEGEIDDSNISRAVIKAGHIFSFKSYFSEKLLTVTRKSFCISFLLAYFFLYNSKKSSIHFFSFFKSASLFQSPAWHSLFLSTLSSL